MLTRCAAAREGRRADEREYVGARAGSVGVSDVPIAEHGFLSDCHSAALVTRDGSVDWLCFPRFDASSVFGRLLDERAGHWRLGVAGAAEITRRFLADTLVLETTSSTSSGLLRQRDALALGEGNRGHEFGAGAPHVLLRTATCLEGEVELEAAAGDLHAGRPLQIMYGVGGEHDLTERELPQLRG